MNLRSVGLGFRVMGRWEEPQIHQMPEIRLWIHLMDLTSDDRHKMQLDPKYVPTPTVNNRLSSWFSFPLGAELV